MGSRWRSRHPGDVLLGIIDNVVVFYALHRRLGLGIDRHAGGDHLVHPLCGTDLQAGDALQDSPLRHHLGRVDCHQLLVARHRIRRKQHCDDHYTPPQSSFHELHSHCLLIALSSPIETPWRDHPTVPGLTWLQDTYQ
jgi:hypothetical protein